MTQRNELQNKPIHPASVGKRMLQGAGIAFIFIFLFLLGAGEPEPHWVVYFITIWIICVARGGWREALAYILSLIVYLIVLWLGTVLGLNGTMWD